MAKPVSEKKFLCVKCGLRTKSCTQSRTPRTSSFFMATRSRLMVNPSPFAGGPRSTSAVNSKTWNTEPHRRMRQFKGVQATCLIGDNTYFIQVPTSSKSSLYRTNWQDVTYVRAAPRGRPLQLPLFLHKGLVLSPARLNLAPLGPTLLQQPIQEFVAKLERSNIVPTNHNCRTEATQAVYNDGSRSNGWQDTIEKIFHKPTGITAKFFLQILATNFVQRSHHTGISQKVLLINWWETRMIWHNVLFPLFYERQWWRFLYFLQQAVYKSSQLSASVVTLICCSGGMNEIFGNWNRNMYHRQGNTDNKHPCPAMTNNSTRKQISNYGGTILVCS